MSERRGVMQVAEVVQFAAANGATIYVDSRPDGPAPSGGLERAGAAERAAHTTRKAAEGFEQALKTIRVTAEASLAQLCDLESKPAEVEVSFGVRLSAGLNAGVLTSGGDANLNVRLLWRADDLAVRSHRKELPSR
jgi:hypothetical protein